MFCIAHLRAEKKRSLNIVLSRFRPFSLDLYTFLRFMCFASIIITYVGKVLFGLHCCIETRTM